MIRTVTLTLAFICSLASAARYLPEFGKSNSDIPKGAQVVDLDKVSKIYGGEYTSKGYLLFPGDSIYFTVSANPSTGYDWIEDHHTNGAFKVKKTYSQGNSGMMGAPGKYTF